MTTLTFTIPLRIKSAANLREHWGAKARRVAYERRLTWACTLELWQTAFGLEGPAWSAVTVALTRIAPRPLDGHDNLRHAFKPVVDELARLLGVDDGDPRVTWEYDQRKGGVREYAVQVEVTLQVAPNAAQEVER